MTDREFVKQHWRESACLRALGYTSYFVQLGNPPVRITEYYPISLKAWAEAAAFTSERLEQVRQLRREIKSAEWSCLNTREMVMESIESGNEYSARAGAKALCFRSRTLARLEAELARLTAGMKPEATA